MGPRIVENAVELSDLRKLRREQTPGLLATSCNPSSGPVLFRWIWNTGKVGSDPDHEKRWPLVTCVYVLLLSYCTRALKSQKNRMNPTRGLSPQSRDNCCCLINSPIQCLVEFNHCNCEIMYMIGVYCNFTAENIMRKSVILKKREWRIFWPKS